MSTNAYAPAGSHAAVGRFTGVTATPNGGIALKAYTPIPTGPDPLLELALDVDELLLAPLLLLVVEELVLEADVLLDVEVALELDVPLELAVLVDAEVLVELPLLLDADVVLALEVVIDAVVVEPPEAAPPRPAPVLPELASPPVPALIRVPVPTAQDASATRPRTVARARMTCLTAHANAAWLSTRCRAVASRVRAYADRLRRRGRRRQYGFWPT